jgi:GTP-binding protein EngB required for normal cell division
MNADPKIAAGSSPKGGRNAKLLKHGTEALTGLARQINELHATLARLSEIGDGSTRKSARKMRQYLASFEPSITMIGQVKAGKTSLVNAMVGIPDLLPADVNPWTSVVTSLHMRPKGFANGDHAAFEFFDQEEWGRLLDRGGRIGELAKRAGHNDEVEKVRRQLEEMREKSRNRLGRKFELLLGQTHQYGYFDQPLIERYVCLGDDFEMDTETSSEQGRFADITKSAQVYMARPELPVGLCIRDTPGVNDTFMMREQITIRAIRESRTCVVVLSAHQALSDVDMALIRLISNVKSRDVVIFVNRIDELSNPSKQVPEIRESIRRTLKAHQGPENAEILFGSAYWANRALTGSLNDMEEASSETLFNWAETALKGLPEAESPQAMIWELSGVPALYRALSARIVEGSGQDCVGKVVRGAANLVSGLRAANRLVEIKSSIEPHPGLDRGALLGQLKQIEAQSLAALDETFAKVEADFHKRLDRSHSGFLDRATASLITHLETYGEGTVWQYDPTGLRVLLRTAYRVFARNAQSSFSKIYEDCADQIAGIYLRGFAIQDRDWKIEPPVAPRVPPPVLLGQTIALDMMSSWWRRWWQKKRGYREYAMNFAEMIKAETDPIVDGLKADHAGGVRDEGAAVLRDFIATQREMLEGLLAQADLTPEELAQKLNANGQGEKMKVIKAAMATLDRLAA